MEIMKKEVDFNGVNLVGVSFEEKLYIIIKNFCEVLGVNYIGQLQRIKRDEVLNKGVCKIHIPSDGGNQETNLLELDFVPLWLAGIKTNQCREEAREFLLEFKLKVKDILSEAFFGKRELLLPGHNAEKFNPSLNDVDNRIPIVRSIESEIVRLYGLLRYHYGWIKERARVQEAECEIRIEKMKRKFFIVGGEELTTKDIDRLNHM